MPDREQLEQAIAALEAQRAILGDVIVDTSLAALRQQLAALETQTQPAEAQRKQATILFGDVTGFTALSETMDAEDVTELMNGLWTRLDQTILDHGGHIDKHIGDAVMAIWGVETAREDDSERALLAALAMQTQIQRFNLETQRPAPLQMRIGVNTGPVLLGTVGITAEFTAMGDAVNTSSRLEQAAAPGTILISQDTAQLVQGKFDLKALEPIAVKGKSEALPVYQVQRARPRTFRQNTRGVEGIRTHTVGRAAELARLQALFQAATLPGAHTCQLVTLCGEAGIGKSRLMDEFEAWLTLRPEAVQYFKGRADLEMQHQPYALVRDLIFFHCQIRPGDSGDLARRKLENGLGAGGIERAQYIGQLLGLDFSHSPALQAVLNKAQQLRGRALVHLCEFFRDQTAFGPLVIFLDDIHWADESSLDALHYLAQALGDDPVLIVCLARPSLFERRPDWGAGLGERAARLDLAPLSKTDCRCLVDEVLQKVDQIPEALRELVVSGAEGNPFYLEELIKMLIEEGVILKDARRWQIDPTRLVQARVPPRLTSILQARLDSLPPEERLTLQPAAVIGRTFWDSAVAQISPAIHQELTDEVVNAALSALQNREMIFPDTSAFSEAHAYTFKHAILRDVTYESVLKRDRRRYHALAAQWLIEHSRERIGEAVGLIAEHLEASGQNEQAVIYLRQAGEQAAARFANAEALRCYQRALDLLPAEKRAERREILLARAALYDVSGAREPQYQDLVALKELVQDSDSSDAQRAEVAKRWAHYFSVTGKHAAAISAAQAAIALAQAAGDRRIEANGYQIWGDSFWHQGNYPAAQEKLELALELAREGGLRLHAANCLVSLGIIAGRMGNRLKARDYYLQSLQIHRELGDRQAQGATLNNLGTAALRLGNYSEALSCYEQSLAIRREVGDRRGESSVLNNLGAAATYLGEYPAAQRYYEQSLRIKQEVNDRRGISLTLSNLALTACSLGAYPAALDFAQRSLRLSREIGARSNEGLGLHNLGSALAGLGRWDEATATYLEELELQREIGALDMILDCQAALARVALHQGQLAQAMSYVEEILPHFDSQALNEMDDLFLIYWSCYQVLKATGDLRAGALLSSAHQHLQERAAQIASPEKRGNFLENIPHHREIVAEFQKRA